MKNIQIFWLALRLFSGLFLAGIAVVSLALFRVTSEGHYAHETVIYSLFSIANFYFYVKELVSIKEDELHEVK